MKTEYHWNSFCIPLQAVELCGPSMAIGNWLTLYVCTNNLNVFSLETWTTSPLVLNNPCIGWPQFCEEHCKTAEKQEIPVELRAYLKYKNELKTSDNEGN